MVARRGERIEVAPDACRRVRSRHHHAGPVRSWDTQSPPGRDGIGSRSVALACVAALLAAQRPPGVSCGLPAMALAHSGERVLPSRSGFLNGLLAEAGCTTGTIRLASEGRRRQSPEAGVPMVS